MDHMILVHLREKHDVANDLGILRHADAERVFDAAYRGQSVHSRAHAADAFAERPRIAWVAVAQDHLDPAPHGARGDGVTDVVTIVQDSFNAEMSFNAGDGIDNDSSAHESPLLAFIGGRLVRVRYRFLRQSVSDRGCEVRPDAYGCCDSQHLANRVGCRIDSRHNGARKPLVKGAVIPEIGLAAANAAVA